MDRRMSEKFSPTALLRRASSFDLERAVQKATLTGRLESTHVLAGVIKEMRQVRCIIVRLNEAKIFPDLDASTDTPIRFIVMVVGPEASNFDSHEMGRVVATFFANPFFQSVIYQAKNRKDFIQALDDFVDQSVVVPPVEIKANQTVDDLKKALRMRRKKNEQYEFNYKKTSTIIEENETTDGHRCFVDKTADRPSLQENPLKRTGKLFGGLIHDIKRRYPYYISDFKDGLNAQCVGSILFMFFAVLAPAITFGGLLGEKTYGWMGTTEVLIAQSICGLLWALFSAQPLLIMGATGPLLVFEKSLYDFCHSQNIEFMVFRVWTGFWICLLSFVTVMFEGSFLIGYVTSFTEDIFSTLIALIFIVESLKFMYKNFHCHYLRDLLSYCNRDLSKNETTQDFVNFDNYSNSTLLNAQIETNDTLVAHEHGFVFLKVCDQPDTALLSAVLVISTFILAYSLRKVRTSLYLGKTLRRIVGDFAVPIALFITVCIDVVFFSKTYIQHLDMPDYFGPTLPEERGWWISPLGLKKTFPVWAVFASIIPAILVYILIFVEVEITELLLHRPDRGLKKGSGFHWDLALVGLLTVFSSLLGLPWMCTAIMQSLAHSNSLTVWKTRVAGKPMRVENVFEQRLTTIGVSILTGICAFLGFILKEIPIAVLFGVFMFLGVMNLAGVGLLERFILMLLPQKYFPDKPYCQKVSMWRMHSYTMIQLVLLVVTWTFKSISFTSLLFPFMLLLICLIRIFVLPKFFTAVELEALDGHEKDKDIIEADDEEHELFLDFHIPV